MSFLTCVFILCTFSHANYSHRYKYHKTALIQTKPPLVGLKPDTVRKAQTTFERHDLRNEILIVLNIIHKRLTFVLPSSTIFWGTVKRKSLQVFKIVAVKLMWCHFLIWHFKHYNLLRQTFITLAFYFPPRWQGALDNSYYGRHQRYMIGPKWL